MGNIYVLSTSVIIHICIKCYIMRTLSGDRAHNFQEGHGENF